MGKRRQLERIFLCILFLGAISVWPVLTFTKAPVTILWEEKRRASEFPNLSWEPSQFAKLPQELEAFFNDRLALRSKLVGFRNFWKLKVLGVSDTELTLAGRDGWLFMRRSVEQWTADPGTERELEVWQAGLEEINTWLAARGIRYVVVIVPMKETVYPEHLPQGYAALSKRPWVDKLIDRLRTRTGVTVIDLREVERNNKWRGRLYRRLDTHWNALGAFVGYRSIEETLHKWFPEIVPVTFSDVKISTTTWSENDLMQALGIKWLMKEHDVPVVVSKTPILAATAANPPSSGIRSASYHREPFATETKNDRLPRAVIFHDSMTLEMQPFLSECFSRALYYWQLPVDTHVVSAERPDVVIHEIAEHNLSALPNDTCQVENLCPGILAEKAFHRGQPVLDSTTAAQLKKQCTLQLCRFTGVTQATIETSDADPQIHFPSLEKLIPPTGKPTTAPHFILRAEITAPADTQLQVFFQADVERAYSQQKSIWRKMRKGRNLVYVEFPEWARGPWRLDPGSIPGRYVIHDLTLSMVQPPAEVRSARSKSTTSNAACARGNSRE